MPKLQLSSGRYSISVPTEYVKLKKWKKGDVLVFAINDKGELAIRKV